MLKPVYGTRPEETEKVRLINMTPHQVKLRGEDGTLTVIPPSGKVSRVTVKEERLGTLGGNIPLYRSVLSDVGELPPEQPGVYYIVSGLTKNQGDQLGRTDLLIPCRLKRNDNKVVIEARGLAI